MMEYFFFSFFIKYIILNLALTLNIYFLLDLCFFEILDYHHIYNIICSFHHFFIGLNTYNSFFDFIVYQNFQNKELTLLPSIETLDLLILLYSYRFIRRMNTIFNYRESYIKFIDCFLFIVVFFSNYEEVNLLSLTFFLCYGFFDFLSHFMILVLSEFHCTEINYFLITFIRSPFMILCSILWLESFLEDTKKYNSLLAFFFCLTNMIIYQYNITKRYFDLIFYF